MVKTLLISAATSSREILAEHLQQNGFQVRSTDKAGKGLHLLRANRFDLVIVDHRIEYDQTKRIFTTPANQETEDYISGRFG